MSKALAIVTALSVIAAACSSQQSLPRDIEFELVASEDVVPSVDRNPRVVVPGGEVVTGGVAEAPAEIAGLWERVGFAGSAPSLADNEALLVVAGGEPVACPWEPRGVELTGHDQVSIAVGDYAKVDCGVEWRPRALALRVDAEDLPPELVLWVGVSRYHFVPLGVDGQREDEAIPGGAMRRGVGFGKVTDELGTATLTGTALSRYPGFDAVHFSFDGQEGFRYTLSYVDPPLRDAAATSVEVAGESFLQIELTPVASHAFGGAERLAAPPGSAITELVLLADEEDTTTWIVGMHGEAALVSPRASGFAGPDERTGSALTIHVGGPGHGPHGPHNVESGE